jgi:hypothetical protein
MMTQVLGVTSAQVGIDPSWIADGRQDAVVGEPAGE